MNTSLLFFALSGGNFLWDLFGLATHCIIPCRDVFYAEIQGFRHVPGFRIFCVFPILRWFAPHISIPFAGRFCNRNARKTFA